MAKQHPRNVDINTLKDVVRDPIQVGDAVLIMTVTLYFIGVVVDIIHDGNTILLGAAGVIPEINGLVKTLRGQEALQVEMLPDEGTMTVARGSIVACYPWRNNLPAQTQ